MSKHGRLKKDIVLLHGYNHCALVLQLLLSLLFMFSPPLLRHATSAGFSSAVGPVSTDSSYSSSFLLNGDLTLRQEVDNGPISGAFRRASSVAVIRVTHAPLPVFDGRVLVAGWVINNRISASAELYDASTDSWLEAGSLSSSADNRNSMFPRSSRILVWGGIIIPF